MTDDQLERAAEKYGFGVCPYINSEITRISKEGFKAGSSWQKSRDAYKFGKLREALDKIAAPKRPDGTYNRCREACEQIAREALKGGKNE